MNRLCVSLALIIVLTACASNTPSRPDKLKGSEVVAAFDRASSPGDAHRVLEPLVGSWDAEVRYWSSPQSRPEVSRATAEAKWILGGRFVEEHYSGTSMGKPVVGRGVFGHDNIRNIYTSFWIDNMSTAFMLSSGEAMEEGRVLRYQGTFLDPVTGESRRTRSTIRIESPNRHVFEMYDELDNGSEFKALEIVYSRRPG